MLPLVFPEDTMQAARVKRLSMCWGVGCVCERERDLQHSIECYRLQDHSLLIQRLDGFTHTLILT